MRKWMRERLERRKKKSPEQSKTPAMPPLQPAYFNPEQEEVDSAASPEENIGSQERETPAESGAPMEATSERETAPETENQPEASGRNQSANRSARGRRRRGGRGRGGRGREQAVAQAFAPKSAVPSEETAGETASAEVGPEAEVEPKTAAPPSTAAPVAQATQRPPKGLVVLAIGLPGSGKSTWFKRHNVVPLSSDMVRSLLFDDVREQRFQDLVFSNLRSMLKARLIARRPMNYVDATNLTPQERQHWIKLAKDYGYEVHAVFFDVPLETCVERHHRRDRVVPEDVMRRMAAKLKPPNFSEGFAKITVVRVKKKEGEQPTAEEG